MSVIQNLLYLSDVVLEQDLRALGEAEAGVDHSEDHQLEEGRVDVLVVNEPENDHCEVVVLRN